MKISILGAGPIPNRLAKKLCGNFFVEIFSSQEIIIDNIEVCKYKKFISKIIDSDIVILAWRGLPSPESEKAEVLKYLVQNISPNAIIFNLSSVAVYGQNLGINFETTVPKPINLYGHSKLDLETYLDTFAISKVCNLRISNVFGDTQFNDIINKMLIANSHNIEINLMAPLKVYRDFISIDSLIEVLANLIDSSNQLDSRNLFNISSGKSVSLFELKKLIEVSLGSQIGYSACELTPNDIEISRVSNLKVSQYLQIFSNNSLDDLKDYLNRV